MSNGYLNQKPIRVLQVVTTMNRGGLETMLMNYYRHIDRNKNALGFKLFLLQQLGFTHLECKLLDVVRIQWNIMQP